MKRGPTVPPAVHLGPDGPSEGPWGRCGVPRGSEHQLRTDTEQSSDLSSPIGSRQAKAGFRHMARRFLSEPDMARFE